MADSGRARIEFTGSSGGRPGRATFDFASSWEERAGWLQRVCQRVALRHRFSRDPGLFFFFFFFKILEQLTSHLHRRVTHAVGAMDRLYQAQFPQNRDEQTLPRGFDGSHLASRRVYPPSVHGTYHTQYSGFLVFFVFHVNRWRKRDLALCDSGCKPSDKKSTHCWAPEMGSSFYASLISSALYPSDR